MYWFYAGGGMIGFGLSRDVIVHFASPKGSVLPRLTALTDLSQMGYSLKLTAT